MEGLGLLAALLSSGLGGTAVVSTRYLAGTLDPPTIGALRFGGGFLVLAVLALRERHRWPKRADLPGAFALGFLCFAVFPILFNAALIHTTAARGALALSTMPLVTMLTGALLGVESPTVRKLVGVLIAMAGVAIALVTSLKSAPPDAWRGDLLMLAATLCMALYSVLSRPYIARSGPIPFAAFGMGIGAVSLTVLSAASGGLATLATLDTAQWTAAAYLSIVCGALIFYLWAFALGSTSPTLVAVSVAINPVTAALLGLPLLGEPISANLIVGLVAVMLGIGIASRPLRIDRRGAAR